MARRSHAKIKILTANSLQFDFSPWKESIDLAFIDGAHDMDTASSDTQNALMMISRAGGPPRCAGKWSHEYCRHCCKATAIGCLKFS
jgi:hypothetical protein